MNIFYLNSDPVLAAKFLCDKHVVKMTLETAQLFSTYFRRTGLIDEKLYRSTHLHHPCQICLNNKHNLIWLAFYFQALLNEYSFRYHKIHKCSLIFNYFVKDLLTNTYDISQLTFPKCMPDEFKRESIIDSYIQYYKYKASIIKPFNYTNRNMPSFLYF